MPRSNKVWPAPPTPLEPERATRHRKSPLSQPRPSRLPAKRASAYERDLFPCLKCCRFTRICISFLSLGRRLTHAFRCNFQSTIDLIRRSLTLASSSVGLETSLAQVSDCSVRRASSTYLPFVLVRCLGLPSIPRRQGPVPRRRGFSHARPPAQTTFLISPFGLLSAETGHFRRVPNRKLGGSELPHQRLSARGS